MGIDRKWLKTPRNREFYKNSSIVALWVMRIIPAQPFPPLPLSFNIMGQDEPSCFLGREDLPSVEERRVAIILIADVHNSL